MESNKFILDIIEPSRMMIVEKGMNIYHLLTQTLLLKIKGEIVEFGCHQGRTAAIMRKTLNGMKSEKRIHVYDSFEGLPKEIQKDRGGPIVFQKGDLKTREASLIDLFKNLKIKKPEIHKGWFKDLTSKDIPSNIAFAHIDGDFYSSIQDSLQKIYPRLSKGAIVVIDDYYDKIHEMIENKLNSNKWNKDKKRRYKVNNYFPGVKKSVDNFFKDKKEKITVLISGDQCHCYFRKL